MGERRQPDRTERTPGQIRYPGVYFVKWGDYIKVGSAGNVELRRRAIESMIPEGRVLPLGWISVPPSAGRHRGDHEDSIHQALAAYRVRGEWFKDCETVRRFILRYASSWPVEV